jgi:hypothetical protein
MKLKVARGARRTRRDRLRHQLASASPVPYLVREDYVQVPDDDGSVLLDAAQAAAIRLFNEGYLGKAAAALFRKPQPHMDYEDMLCKLRALHPSGRVHSPYAAARPATHIIAAADVAAAIKSLRRGRSPGPSGEYFPSNYLRKKFPPPEARSRA